MRTLIIKKRVPAIEIDLDTGDMLYDVFSSVIHAAAGNSDIIIYCPKVGNGMFLFEKLKDYGFNVVELRNQ